MSSDEHKQDCRDCKHCVVVIVPIEVRSRKKYWSASCSKGNEVIELDINDFTPKEYCKDFEEGEPAYY